MVYPGVVWGVGHGVWWVGTGYGVVGRVVGLAVLYRALLYRALLYRAWLYCTGLAVPVMAWLYR